MNPKAFNIEQFNEAVKTIRNAHRSATDEKNDVTTLEKQKAQLSDEVAKAAQACNMELVTEKSAELRRVIKKLEDGPQAHIDNFNKGLADLEKVLAGEALEEVKEAA